MRATQNRRLHHLPCSRLSFRFLSDPVASHLPRLASAYHSWQSSTKYKVARLSCLALPRKRHCTVLLPSRALLVRVIRRGPFLLRISPLNTGAAAHHLVLQVSVFPRLPRNTRPSLHNRHNTAFQLCRSHNWRLRTSARQPEASQEALCLSHSWLGRVRRKKERS